MRKVTFEKGIGGLQDVVVSNACSFSDSGGLQPGFIRVINIWGNHWIMLSNLLCTIDETCVYDSYLELVEISRTLILRKHCTVAL